MPPRPSAATERQAAVASQPQSQLQSFANPHPGRDFQIHIQIPEFTCLCPLTGQPDFACLYLDYIPDQRCVELKSLKLYIWHFRDQGMFHEAVTNQILDHIVDTIDPRFARLTAKWYVRGGIFTNVVVEHRQTGWSPPVPVLLAGFSAESNVRG